MDCAFAILALFVLCGFASRVCVLFCGFFLVALFGLSVLTTPSNNTCGFQSIKAGPWAFLSKKYEYELGNFTLDEGHWVGDGALMLRPHILENVADDSNLKFCF